MVDFTDFLTLSGNFRDNRSFRPTMPQAISTAAAPLILRTSLYYRPTLETRSAAPSLSRNRPVLLLALAGLLVGALARRRRS